MNMKIKVLILFSPLMLVVLLPVIVGMIAKGDFDDVVELTAKAGFQIEESGYDVGWRSSLVTHEFMIPQADRDILVSLETSMLHGPYRDGVTGEWMWFSADTEIYIDGEPLYSADVPPVVRTRIGIDRTGFTLVDMPSTEWPINDFDFIDFRGLVVFLNLSLNKRIRILDIT